MTITSAALVGLGAVGAMYAWRLQNYMGFDALEILVDAERFERYKKDGIFLNGKRTDFNLKLAGDIERSVDLVIIATKNNHLDEVLELIEPCVGSHTMLLSLLNGLDSEDLLEKRFGEQHVLYGFTTALDSTRHDNSIDFSNEGTVYIGESNNQVTERLAAVKTLLNESGIACKIPQDIHLEMWSKFMVNVSINTISAITRATYGQCVSIGPIRNLIIETQKEVIALARASKIIGLDEHYIDRYQAIFASLEPSGKTSMLQDVEAKRPTENQWFCKKASRIGDELGIATPLCDFLGELVEGIDMLAASKN